MQKFFNTGAMEWDRMIREFLEAAQKRSDPEAIAIYTMPKELSASRPYPN
jgi:hypothetical protein